MAGAGSLVLRAALNHDGAGGGAFAFSSRELVVWGC